MTTHNRARLTSSFDITIEELPALMSLIGRLGGTVDTASTYHNTNRAVANTKSQRNRLKADELAAEMEDAS